MFLQVHAQLVQITIHNVLLVIKLNVSHVLPVTFTEPQNHPVSCFLLLFVATVIGCTKSKHVMTPTPTTTMDAVLTAKSKLITFA